MSCPHVPTSLHRSLRSCAVLAAGIFALVACQDSATSSNGSDSGPIWAYAAFSVSDSSRIPDSVEWNTTTQSDHGGLRVVGLSGVDTLLLGAELGSDTAHVRLWAYGIRIGSLRYVQSGRSPNLVLCDSAYDSLDLKLLAAFRKLRTVKADSFAALGTVGASSLVRYYASRLLSQDTALRGFPTTRPVGMSVDSVKKDLVLLASLAGKSWSQLVALGLDQTSVRGWAANLLQAGLITASDTSALFLHQDTTRPVIRRVSPSTDTTVEWNVSSISLSWLVTDDSLLSAVQLSGSVLTGSAGYYQKTVALSHGENVFVLQASDAHGNKSCDTLRIVRRTDATFPVAIRVSPTRDTVILSSFASFTASWTVSDNMLESVRINDTEATGTSGLYSRTVALSGDSLWIRLVANDSSGNTTRDSVKIRRLAPPAISPAGPTILSPSQTDTVTLTSAMADSMEYSTDKSTWNRYTSPIVVSKSLILYVRSKLAGSTSNVDSAVFLYMPTLALVSGGYSVTQTLRITAPGSPTIEDSLSTGTAWNTYSTPLTINSTVAVYARSRLGSVVSGTVKNMYDMAGVVAGVYVFPPTVAPASGTYMDSILVSATDVNADSTKYSTDTTKGYWRDISYGKHSSEVVSLSKSSTVYFRSYLSPGQVPSPVVVRTYVITHDTTAPVIKRGAGTNDTAVVNATTTATLSWTVTDDAKIGSVKVNGAAITGTNGVYSTTVNLTVGTNRFILTATDSVGNQSKDTVQIIRNAMAPLLYLGSGNYIGPINDTISSDGADSIQYSLDGTKWAKLKVNYFGIVVLSSTGTYTLYARAWPGGATSSATYTISATTTDAAGRPDPGLADGFSSMMNRMTFGYPSRTPVLWPLMPVGSEAGCPPKRS